MNRKLAAHARYDLYEQFYNKNLSTKTLYIIYLQLNYAFHTSNMHFTPEMCKPQILCSYT